MSDTTSFLGGAALAGLAAVILLRGGVNAGSPVIPSSQPLPIQPYPTATMPPVNLPPSVATPAPTAYDLEKQRLETDQLRAQLEQQRVQTEQLKIQLQSQQALIDTLNRNNGIVPTPARTTPPGQQPALLDQSSPVMTGILWALGGMLLAFGGGIALVGMFVLFARQQRPSRTIEVVHDEYPGYLPARRRSQVLPPRRVIKRVEAEEMD
jgi:hypothetical protein